MTSAYEISDKLFLHPTPAGAYYAVASREANKSRQLLLELCAREETPALTPATLRDLTKLSDLEKSYELLYHCQNGGLLQGLENPIKAPSGALEQFLPDVLSKISPSGKVLLADYQGFYLACHGFEHEVAEELSALSAEVATVHERRSGLLQNNLGLSGNAWAFVDIAGNSQIGFWPIYIGDTRFSIVISGLPHFNQPEFVDLVWSLSIRYATNTM